MVALIDDLLQYSHVSQRPQEMEEIDLAQKLNRVLEDLELDIKEKNAQFIIKDLPVVQGHRRQLQQLFQNLISNAIKYIKEGVEPLVEISGSLAEENDRQYHLVTIKDNGIGFSEEHNERIFQMFTRLHNKSKYSGTGVGLSIVKKVAENHNGFVRVKSSPGEGASFTIYLPKLYHPHSTS